MGKYLVALAVVFLLVIGPCAAIVIPLVRVARRLFGPALLPWHAAAGGAAVGPALLFILWLVLRENDETIGGLVQFWIRMPGEFLVGAIPLSLAAALFGWLAAVATSAVPRRRRA